MTDPLVPLRRSAEPDAVGRLLAKAAPSMKTPALGAEARAKILASLPAAGAAPVAAAFSLTKLAGLVVGAGVIGAIAWTTLGGAPVAPRAPVESAPAPVIAASEPPAAPVSAPAPVFSVHDLPTAAPVAASGERRAASTPVETDTLSREVAILDRARASGDPATALTILGEHARAFPDGKLAPEREVFAVEALLQAGRRDEARARGEAFIRAQPGSAHAARVRALLR
ncbi:MAG: hypothetical protein KF819_13435 [Labilithrix sp.]|nr:hypothetical protein [Labilithrix sp.]